jgi:signal peptidase II
LNRKILIFSVVCTVGVALDQATKYWVRTSEAVNSPGGIPVIPHLFSIVHAENPGAAFGMLGNLSQEWRIAVFALFTLIATGIVIDIFLSTTLGLILSGALGNVIDRLVKPLYGMKATVTDFLRFYTDNPDWSAWLDGMFGMSEYPSFNIADANLVIGVGLFLVHYLFIEGRGGEEDVDDEEDDEDDQEPTDEITGKTDTGESAA